MSPVELQEFLDKIKEVNLSWGGFEKSIDTLKNRAEAAAKGLRDEADTRKVLKRAQDEYKKELDLLKAAVAEGRRTDLEYEAEVQKLNAQLELELQNLENADEANKSLVRATRASIAATNAKNIGEVKAATFINDFSQKTKISSAVLTGLGSAVGKLVDAVAGGSADLALAGQATTLAVQAVGKGGSIIGDGLGSVGGILTTFGGKIPRVGKFVQLLGEGLSIAAPIVGKVSKGLSDVALGALPILQKQLEMQYNSFVSLSTSGAMFANGITGMVNAAGKANLLLPEFAEVVKEQSVNLAASGIGVTEAAKQMGEVGTVMKKNGIARELLNLGIGYKEQAAAVAETMAQMRQSGGRLTSSDEVVAAQTQKYAENLKIIAAITGEDARKKEAQVKEEANKLAFQQKLNGLDEVQRSNVIQAMQNMSDAQRKAFEETVVFGRTITPESAALVANVSGFGDLVNTAAKQFQDGTLDANTMRATQAQYGETIKQSLLQQTGIAQAAFANAGELATALGNAMGNELQFLNKTSPEAIAAATKALEEQKKTTDKQTEDTLAAVEAGRKLAEDVQKKVLESNVMGLYANAVKDTTTTMTNLIDTFTSEQSKISGISTPGKTAAGANQQSIETGKVIGEGVGMVAGEVIGGALGSFAGPVGTLIGGAAGAALGSYLGGLAGGFIAGNLNKPSAPSAVPDATGGLGVVGAAGGIATGPRSGYRATLHGTEAIVPLPQGMDANTIGQALQNTLTPSNTDNLKNVGGTSSAESLLMALGTKLDDLIDATKDVAQYTKDTSVRIM